MIQDAVRIMNEFRSFTAISVEDLTSSFIRDVLVLADLFAVVEHLEKHRGTTVLVGMPIQNLILEVLVENTMRNGFIRVLITNLLRNSQ